MKALLTTLLLIIAVAVVFIASRPSEFKVTRTATINASPESIFPHVNDLHQWDAWSPWAKIDPNAKMTFEGPQSGVGAKMTWSGNNDVGEGSLTIEESTPSSKVRYRLDFVRPFGGTSMSEFTLAPKDGATEVTWV